MNAGILVTKHEAVLRKHSETYVSHPHHTLHSHGTNINIQQSTPHNKYILTSPPRRDQSWQNEEFRAHCISLLLECRIATPRNKTVPALVHQMTNTMIQSCKVNVILNLSLRSLYKHFKPTHWTTYYVILSSIHF